MNSAYLYVRVSTDEQRRKGYSLPEQEERLLRHCEMNNIVVRGIYREDYSAKNFKRPEWQKLLAVLKVRKNKQAENVLFIKWDRFSRNIEYAYQMLGLLRSFLVQAMAIDQPIDFSIPESTVMLAVYLSIPEAENTRRALNVTTGMRRGKLVGRWMATAPKGYINLSYPDGRKYIAPKEPEASFMRQAFEEIAKGVYHADQVRKLMNERGFDCSKQNFWRIIRNPVYCGIIVVAPYDGEDIKFVKATHEPLIDESLFYDVQDVINGNKRKTIPTKIKTPDEFPLRGFLKCCKCGKMLTGSLSKGKYKRYWYYHCYGGCNVRFAAKKVNQAFELELHNFTLSPIGAELFKMIAKDEYKHIEKSSIYDWKKFAMEIEEQEEVLSSARRKLLKDIIDENDYKAIKKECTEKIHKLESRMAETPRRQENMSVDGLLDTFIEKYTWMLTYYRGGDISMKRHIISSMFPEKLQFDGMLLRTPEVSDPLSLILSINSWLKSKKIREDLMDFKSSRGVVPTRIVKTTLICFKHTI